MFEIITYRTRFPGFSRDEPDVTSNMQDRPACNIICVAIYNELPAGHILSPTAAGIRRAAHR